MKLKKHVAVLLISFLCLIGLVTQHAWSSNGLPRIDNKTLAKLSLQHPVVVLFRHAERCDRSSNECLSDKTGITVKGANDARSLGKELTTDIKKYDLYASDTVRTIQSATWFATDKKVTVDKKFQQCGKAIYSAINDVQMRSPDKNIIIFAHNHCLSYIAKDKRDVKFSPDYLDGLVMHVENGKLFLDGEFVRY